MYNPYPAAVFGVPITLGFLYLPYYTGCTLFLFYLVSAFDFIICFVSCFCARHYTGCTLFNFTVSAFDIIFGRQMPFECTTHIRLPFFGVLIALGFLYLPHYTGCTLFLFYFVSAFDFTICFVSCFCARHYTGCTLFNFTVSAFDIIFGRQMPFECTTHIRPPFFGVPIALGFLYLPHYTGCTLFLFYFVSAFDFTICFVSCFCARHYTGCSLFNFTVSAFDLIICFVSCFCARQYTGLYTIYF